jgi:hypothetical protein
VPAARCQASCRAAWRSPPSSPRVSRQPPSKDQGPRHRCLCDDDRVNAPSTRQPRATSRSLRLRWRRVCRCARRSLRAASPRRPCYQIRRAWQQSRVPRGACGAILSDLAHKRSSQLRISMYDHVPGSPSRRVLMDDLSALRRRTTWRGVGHAASCRRAGRHAGARCICAPRRGGGWPLLPHADQAMRCVLLT